MNIFYENTFIMKIEYTFQDFYKSLFGECLLPFINKKLIRYTFSQENDEIRCDITRKKNHPTVNFMIDKDTFFHIPYDKDFDFIMYYKVFAFCYAIYCGKNVCFLKDQNYPYHYKEHQDYIKELYSCIICILPSFDTFDDIENGTLFELKSDLFSFPSEKIVFNVLNALG